MILFNYLSLPILFKGQPTSSIHQFTATAINGQIVDFQTLKGKKILIVNTASECGLTPQYKQLQELYTAYKDKGLVVVGFPSNDFGKQEPGSLASIQNFCQVNYGVTFLMMEKVKVKGPSIHPIYRWLTNKSENGVMNTRVKWNFQKYLVDENGYLVDRVTPWKKPDCQKIIKWLNSSKAG